MGCYGSYDAGSRGNNFRVELEGINQPAGCIYGLGLGLELGLGLGVGVELGVGRG